MAHRDDATLVDIGLALAKILIYIDGVDEASFRKDDLRVDAVLHQLTLAGEAVKRLSKETRDAHPEIPWGDIARMRDRLIHAYDAVDLAIVWDTARNKAPIVLARLQPLLPKKDE
jgi:uncharacterized protein with HEPN domain